MTTNTNISSQTRVYGVELNYFGGSPMVSCWGIGYTDGVNMQAICTTGDRARLMSFQPDGIGRSYEEAYNNALDKIEPEYYEWLDEQRAVWEDED